MLKDIKICFPDIKFSLPIIICSDNHDIKNYHVKEKCGLRLILLLKV